MLFNSYEFILVFLPATLVLHFGIARYSPPASRHFLLIASFVFYAWWSVEYGLLLLLTVAINYSFGRTIQGLVIARPQVARVLLTVAIAANVGLLAYFKYRNFFIENFNAASGTEWPIAPLVLPLAISFHTFQQIAYLVDSFRRKVEQPTFLAYALFVLFFPQLIAGPIVHHYQLLPQLASRTLCAFDYRYFGAGLGFFVIGLAKKVLLADPLVAISDPVFQGALTTAPTMSSAWAGVLAYSLGLYFDFSGYSDMAVGLARMFGVKLPYNFDSPYKATSIIDFWRRWHITLSVWLRDYVYIPLGGSRYGRTRRYANLMATMLLGGLWHGAAWTFVLWGALHGMFLMINHAWREVCTGSGAAGNFKRVPAIAAGAATFLAVTIAWVFFRSQSMGQALNVLEALVGLHGLHSDALFAIVGPGKGATLAVAAAIVWLLPNAQQLIDSIRTPIGLRLLALRWRPSLPWAAAFATLFLLTFTQMSKVREFVYFQF